VSIALLALAIEELGCDARSFLGHQVQIRTDGVHGSARIRTIDATPSKRRCSVAPSSSSPGSRVWTKRAASRRSAAAAATCRRWPWRGAQGRRLRNLQRCRRHLHDRPERLRTGAPHRPHQRRRDAGARQPGRQGPAGALRRIRVEIQGCDPLPAPRFTTRGKLGPARGAERGRSHRHWRRL